jgi:Zn-dependent peptidase ImmA (M78 family)
VGHIKIPWHCGSIACHIDEGNASVTGDHYSYEGEAHRFASELLMPTDWVRQVIEEELTIEKIFNRIVDGAEVSKRLSGNPDFS